MRIVSLAYPSSVVVAEVMSTSWYGNPSLLSRGWRILCDPDVQRPARAGESIARSTLALPLIHHVRLRRLLRVLEHNPVVHLGQRDGAANGLQVQVGLEAFQRMQGPRALLLPVVVVNEGAVLRHQHIVA